MVHVSLLPQCFSVTMLLQPVFYGLRLRSAAGTFSVDYGVELIDLSLKERSVTLLKMGEENGVIPHRGSPKVGRP